MHRFILLLIITICLLPIVVKSQCPLNNTALFNARLGTIQALSNLFRLNTTDYDEFVDAGELVYTNDSSITVLQTGTFGGPNGGGIVGVLEYLAIAHYHFNHGLVNIYEGKAVGLTVLGPNKINFVSNSNYTWYDGLHTDLNNLADMNVTFKPCETKIYEHTVSFEEETVLLFAAGIDALYTLCDRIQTSCVGNNQVYADLEECLKYFEFAPRYGCQDPLLKGDGIACRFLHSLIVPVNPDIHCIHTAPVSPACVPEDCIIPNDPSSKSISSSHQVSSSVPADATGDATGDGDGDGTQCAASNNLSNWQDFIF